MQKADPIFVHPDVRRMLMDAKAYSTKACEHWRFVGRFAS